MFASKSETRIAIFKITSDVGNARARRPLARAWPLLALTLALSTVLAEPARAVNRALILLGGGETTNLNRYRDEGGWLAEGLVRNNWDVKLLWAGTADEVLAKSKRYLRAEQIDKLTRRKVWSELLRAYDELVAGDQFLFVVNSHGGEFLGLHRISLAERSDEDFYIAGMMKLVADLKGRGVRVAIADGSCYSGLSVQLLQAHACVLSAQSSNLPAYTSDLATGLSGTLGELLNAKPQQKNVWRRADANSNGALDLSEAFEFYLANAGPRLIAFTAGITLQHPVISQNQNSAALAEEAGRLVGFFSDQPSINDEPPEAHDYEAFAQRLMSFELPNVTERRYIASRWRKVAVYATKKTFPLLQTEAPELDRDYVSKLIVLLQEIQRAAPEQIKKVERAQRVAMETEKPYVVPPVDAKLGKIIKQFSNNLTGLRFGLHILNRLRNPEPTPCSEFELFPAKR